MHKTSRHRRLSRRVKQSTPNLEISLDLCPSKIALIYFLILGLFAALSVIYSGINCFIKLFLIIIIIKILIKLIQEKSNFNLAKIFLAKKYQNFNEIKINITYDKKLIITENSKILTVYISSLYVNRVFVVLYFNSSSNLSSKLLAVTVFRDMVSNKDYRKFLFICQQLKTLK